VKVSKAKGDDSIVVEYSSHHAKVKGLIPATPKVPREKMTENKKGFKRDKHNIITRFPLANISAITLSTAIHDNLPWTPWAA
jgi:hypothetical protein